MASKRGIHTTTLALPDALRLADEHRRSGRLGEAEAICRKLLAGEESYADAWHLLGLIQHGKGEPSEAVRSLRRAVELRDDVSAYHANLARVLLSANETAAAIESLRKAADLEPTPDVLRNLGVGLLKLGNSEEAAAVLASYLDGQPDDATAHVAHGDAFMALGKRTEAEASYRRVTAIDSTNATAHMQLGNALFELDRMAPALAAYDEAIVCDPDGAKAHFNRGNVLFFLERFDEAEAAFRRALAIDPHAVSASTNLANMLLDLGQYDDALAAFDHCVEIDPNGIGARFNRALLLLRLGRFDEAWPEYEWRWHQAKVKRRSFRQPEWDGNTGPDTTLLLWAEQGLGDAVQFVRYAPLVRQRVGRLVVECLPTVAGLVGTVDGVDAVVHKGTSLPEFDVQCPLLSLPRVLRTELETIPGGVPYLRAPAARGEVTELIGHRAPGTLAVGLAWAGRKGFMRDKSRSMRLDDLAPLAAIDGIAWFGLQKSETSDSAGAPIADFPLVDLARFDRSLGDAAATIMHLDLVISVDTSIVHVAGALGRPVWILLSHVADWRWLTERDDSPWYPTMRLFRQRRRGDWSDVVAAVERELQALVVAG